MPKYELRIPSAALMPGSKGFNMDKLVLCKQDEPDEDGLTALAEGTIEQIAKELEVFDSSLASSVTEVHLQKLESELAQPKPELTPEPTPTPEPKPEPELEPKPKPTPKQKLTPEPKPEPPASAPRVIEEPASVIMGVDMNSLTALAEGTVRQIAKEFEAFDSSLASKATEVHLQKLESKLVQLQAALTSDATKAHLQKLESELAQLQVALPAIEEPAPTIWGIAESVVEQKNRPADRNSGDEESDKEVPVAPDEPANDTPATSFKPAAMVIWAGLGIWLGLTGCFVLIVPPHHWVVGGLIALLGVFSLGNCLSVAVRDKWLLSGFGKVAIEAILEANAEIEKDRQAQKPTATNESEKSETAIQFTDNHTFR